MPRSALLLLATLAAGCTRAPPEPAVRETAALPGHASASSRVAPSSASPALSAPAESAERPFRFPPAERVVAVGDLHGDLASTREALRLAGAIDETERWIGKKLVLVQVGDQ